MRRKRKRKKKKNLSSKSIICITTIAMLNAVGISYGSWNQGQEISTKISTGNMSVRFIDIDVEEKDGKYTYKKIYQTIMEDQYGKAIQKEETSEVITVDIKDELRVTTNRYGENATIQGSIIDENGSSHTVTVEVKNLGTIPIKLKEVKNGSYNDDIKIKPDDSAIFEIQGNIEPGIKNKDIILIFEQSI